MGASTHGSKTIITADGDVLTGCNTSGLTRGHDTHDKTEYGDNNHGQVAGIGKHKFTCGGWYDKTRTTGSRDVLQPLADSGATVEWTRKPEGTGTGNPLETFNGFVASYVETSPATDIVTWTAEIEIDGGITTTSQP